MIKGKKENSIFLAKTPYRTWSQINTTKRFGGMHIYTCTFVLNNNEIQKFPEVNGIGIS